MIGVRIILLATLFVAACNAQGESGLSTHILDNMKGLPAVGVRVQLYQMRSTWGLISECVTDWDGRCRDVLQGIPLENGLYKLYFNTGEYYANEGQTEVLFPTPELIFDIPDATQHYHVPMLMTPFSYTTYKGR